MTHQVLIIEDEPLIASLLADFLTSNGYEVTTADSAFGAATLVRKLRPAAVLLGLGLPFRPATALLDELKADKRTADVPVVVVSGMTESLSEGRRAMAAAVLEKPIDFDRLLAVLLEACDGISQGSGPA